MNVLHFVNEWIQRLLFPLDIRRPSICNAEKRVSMSFASQRGMGVEVLWN
jgi:hypothetical protein